MCENSSYYFFTYFFPNQTKLEYLKKAEKSEWDRSFLSSYLLFISTKVERTQSVPYNAQTAHWSFMGECLTSESICSALCKLKKMNTSVHRYSNYEVFLMSILVSTEQRSRETKKTRGSTYSLVPQITKYIMESDRWPLRITDKR